MASVIPKIKMFLFISFIALLINISACAVAYLNSEQSMTDYTSFTDEEIKTYEAKDDTNISVSNFAFATGTSFLPFIDIINLAFLGLDLVTSIIIGIIVGIIGALKLFLLVNIALGYVPFIDA